ncbi:MAG: hypothetical protein Q7T10_12685 [Rhodoferax sp.]|uniref:hypothetical protein n=1 Tax=Rhodoferax sp. TaxID=50421 RepID=UPI0027272DFF|nr:hypothetical protein [Rhodoferax sp.]MDO8449648.1 hypothetical protein [Rhodoferax sp.]
MAIRRTTALVSLFSLLLALAGAAGAQPVSFGLFGDTPYSHWERARLPELMSEMDSEDLAFVVHDGDIKSGGSVCSDEVLRDILGVFQASKTPLVYVPGDNEWTDCHRKSNGGYDPLERLAKLRELFFVGDAALGQRTLPLERQSRNPAFASYRENVRWEAGGALFVGLNLPGSENNYHGSTHNGGPVPEFVERSAANRAWLAQAFALARVKRLAGILIVIQANPGFEAFSADRTRPGYREFLMQLRAETQAFAGRVVLVHGDTHWHRIDQPLLNDTGKELVSNFTRVETFGYPFPGWIKATVDAADPQVFRFSPRPWRAPSPQN